MTTEEVFQMLEEIGVPIAYHHFRDDDPENPAPDPPFICFYYPGDDDFFADDINYIHINQLVVELYTEKKDFALEAKTEAVLTSYELPFSKTENYIESETMYMITYETEVIING